MKFSNDNPMAQMSWSRSNNLIAGGYADGKVSLFSVTPSRDQPGSVTVETLQVLEAHRKKITTVAWSENGKYLATGDSSGKIAFFKKKEKGWKNTIANSSVTSPVNSISFNKSSKLAAIAYQDGTCACVMINGELSWSNMMRQVIEHLEWSQNSKVLLCGTSFGEVLVIDQQNGVELNTVPLPCLSKAKAEPKIVGIQWHRRADYGLLIAFQCGSVQLMRNESDTQPFTIQIEVEISAVTWFKSGSAFVVSGKKPHGSAVAIFFNSHGDAIRELELQGNDIHALSLDPTDTSLAITSDNHFCLAQIMPSIHWSYTNNTLLYLYDKNNDNVYTAIFFNRKSSEMHLQTYANVLSVSGHSGYFAFATKAGPEECLITVTNTIGVTVATTKVSILPFSSTFFGKSVAFISLTKVCVWNFLEEEAPQVLDFTDKVHAAFLHEKILYLSVGQQIIVLDILSFSEITRYTINMTVESIGASSDGSCLSLIDSFGTLQFFNTAEKRIIGPVCKEVWNSKWSSENSTQFVSLERQKLVVYNGIVQEEPVACLSHVAEFTDLEILTVDLIFILKDPMNPSSRYFRSHPTKQLRQLRKMLSARPETTLDDICAFAKAENQIKLWEEIAETTMLEMNFSYTERCYLETLNYKGLQFIKRIRTVKDPNIQRAQVLSYFGKFDEAESIYLSMDRLDLAVEMRRNIGDFHHVIKIMGNGVCDDETIDAAYTAVGEEFAENARWHDAAEAFMQAKNDEKLMNSLFLANDIQGLERLMLSLPQTSPLLKKIGEMFVSVGAVNDAVTAFTSINDIGSAIDACARMNHWKPALKLAGKGRNDEIKSRMVSYAQSLIDNQQRAAAVDFYVRAGLNIEAAKLLLKEGDNILKVGDDFISAKMCYVFAGLQLEAHRQDAFDGTINADERLDGLMKEDEVTTSGLLREIWRKAEGVHFLLLSNRFVEQRKWKDALFSACRVYDEYSDIVGEIRASALLALCGTKTRFFGQCSRALTTLEHSDECTKKQKEQFESLAIDIFTKNNPNDPSHVGIVSCPKCTAVVSMLQSQCPECGERIRVCYMSGRLIDGSEFWECKVCKHCVLYEFAESMSVCPLCHHAVDQ